MRREVSTGAVVLQVLTWMVAAAVLLPWSSMLATFTMQKEALPEATADSVVAFMDAKLARAQNSPYTMADYVQDGPELAVLRDQIRGYKLPAPMKGLDLCVQERIEELLLIAKTNEKERLGLTGTKLEHVDITGFGLGSLVTDRVRSLWAQHWRPGFLPKLSPREEVRQYTWRGFAYRWLIAWLWTLPLAVLAITWRLRSQGTSILSEWRYKPFEALAANVFWWYGFSSWYAEPGHSALEEKVLRWEQDRRRMTGRHPTDEEQAAFVLSVDPSVSVAQALRIIRQLPEEIEVRSRRAVFTSMLLGMLWTPIQAVMTAATAMAQTLRATGGSVVANVDTTRKDRKRESDLWGYLQVQGSKDGVDLPFARVVGKQSVDGMTVTGEVDLKTPKLKKLGVRIPLGTDLSLDAGLINSPVINDFPPPFNDLFADTPLLDHAPPLQDYGATFNLNLGGTSISLGVLNGGDVANVDGAIQWVGRVDQRFAPFHVSALWLQSELLDGQPPDYRAYFARYDGPWATQLEIGRVERHDRNVAAHHLRLQHDRSHWRLGLQLEDPRGVLLTVERKLAGDKNRVAAHYSVREDEAPHADVLFQRSFAFTRHDE